MGSPRTGAAARSPPRVPSHSAALSAQRVQPRSPGRCCPRCGAERGAAAAPGPAQPNPPPPVSPAAAFRPLPLAPGVPSPLPRGAERSSAARSGPVSAAERRGAAGSAGAEQPHPRSRPRGAQRWVPERSAVPAAAPRCGDTSRSPFPATGTNSQMRPYAVSLPRVLFFFFLLLV